MHNGLQSQSPREVSRVWYGHVTIEWVLWVRCGVDRCCLFQEAFFTVAEKVREPSRTQLNALTVDPTCLFYGILLRHSCCCFPQLGEDKTGLQS